MAGDLKTTAEERARLREDSVPSGFHGRPSARTIRVLDDIDTLLAENAKLSEDWSEQERQAAASRLALARASKAQWRAECSRLLAENAKLRAVAEAARARCRDAVPEWAPELRTALAALEEP